MPTITLTVGLPGCGKTTWAEQEIKKAKSKTININRDDIRESMAGSHDAYKFNDANEKYVTNLQFSAAKLAAENYHSNQYAMPYYNNMYLPLCQ